MSYGYSCDLGHVYAFAPAFDPMVQGWEVRKKAKTSRKRAGIVIL